MKLFLISILPFIYFSYIKTKHSFHMLQQNYYDDDNRYFKWILTNIRKVMFDSDFLFVLIPLLMSFDVKVSRAVFATLYIVIIVIYRSKMNRFKTKLPLVMTARIKRLLFTMFLIYFVFIIPFVVFYDENNIVYYYFFIGFMTYINFFVVMAAIFINKPVEKLVYLSFRIKAIKKLKSMNIPVVGITGSYGKTSSKNIVNDILNVKFNSFATPKSFNTPYGLIKSINMYLDKFNDVFIAEMGAFKRGEIKQNCDLVHPKYGIITTIGEAHLATFKSRDNIMKGKFELVEALPSDGVAILNIDDPYQVRYVNDYLKSKCKILWIGIDNKEADIYATNIRINSTGTTFDCVFKNTNEKQTFKTKLLGKHNVYNVLAGIMLGYELGLSINQLKQGVASVKATEHRLELKKQGAITIIDDAYNSNPVGAKAALDVLKLMDGIKIVTTPGMIELGDKQYELNKEFGKQISEVSDYVILIGKKQTKPIYDGLIEQNFDTKKIFILDDVREAFPLMNRLAKGNTYVLLENDLPDMFNE